MLRLALSLRYLMLIGSLGAMVGALVMFWTGAQKLGSALRALASHESSAVVVSVMGATDAFLFSIVLMIFAYAVAFGFVFDLPEAVKARLPRWVRVEGVGELKHTLLEVVLVYLVIDFATDIAATEGHLSWQTLVMPLSILCIAGAVRLMSGTHSHP